MAHRSMVRRISATVVRSPLLMFFDVVRAATGALWPDSDDRTRDAIDSVLGAESAADGKQSRLAEHAAHRL